jgi:hypothetical protein
MRLLRGLLGVLLWILAGLLGLVGVVLCLTIILLPLGIPLVVLAGRLFTRAVQLMLPREVAHPIREVKKTSKKQGKELKKTSEKKGKKVGAALSDVAGEASKRMSDAAGDAAKKGRKVLRQERKRIA